MNIRAIAFTEKGQSWQEKLGFPVTRGVPVMQWAREAFADADALLFIGACGIAVRAIAPLCRNKAADPAVLVMDEMGRHIIPILSGHIGGANDLALLLAERTGAEPVLTTATDVRGVPAIDSWAMKNDCAIENKAAILALCEKYRFPLQTYSAAELNAVPGVFAHSDFVMKTVGCGCVCERAAVMTGGRLLVGKTAMQGVTLALAGEENV